MFPFKILNKKKYSLYFINGVIQNLSLYLVPVVLSFYLTIPFSLNKFLALIVIILLLKGIEIVTNSLFSLKFFPFLENYKKDLDISYLKRIYSMNKAKINHIHTGYLKKEIDTITTESYNLLYELIRTVPGFFIATGIFLIQVGRQSLFLMVLCFFVVIFIVIYNVKLIKIHTEKREIYNDFNAKYNATSVDVLQNISLVKNFEAIDFSTSIINQKFDDVRPPLKKSMISQSLIVDGTNFLVYVMFLILMLHLFFLMQDGVDIFSYLVFYVTIFNSLNVELVHLSQMFLYFNKFHAANKQIEEMIGEEEKQLKFRNFDNITLKDIEFKYHKNSKNVIKIPYFSINKKDKISIVGESGQGKSTFLSIFCRFYAIDNGKYIVDDISTNRAPDVTYISQEVDLFDLSIRDNLLLGKSVSDKKLKEYLDDAGLLDWVNSLEDGLDTLVGEKGICLSTGQKQRLNIIRGILLDKDIYILDEPTSNLDRVSEHRIYDMISKYLKDKTCIIVTHRMELTRLCNKHYYFKDKEMLEN